MQAIILAAGKSTRCYPLTANKHKAMLKVANKYIMHYNLDCLVGLVDEVIIVVSGELIKQTFGDDYHGLKLVYFEQKGLKGTGDAMRQVAHLIKGSFILMHGDDIYLPADIVALAKLGNGVLVSESETPECFGVIEHKDSQLIKIVEKPEQPKSNLVNCACYKFEHPILELLSKLKPSSRGELEFTDAINEFACSNKVNYVKAKRWLELPYAWSLLNANSAILKTLPKQIEGSVEPRATVKGKLSLGKGSIVMNGAYLEGDIIVGENTQIGPNCYIRGSTSIGSGCKVGNGVEVKNSILMDGVKVGHLSYVGDSILGENVNFGAGTKVANLKHDNTHVKTMVKGKLVDTGRRKLGTIIGENVHTGINTSIYPGRKLWPNTSTRPGDIVQKDVLK